MASPSWRRDLCALTLKRMRVDEITSEKDFVQIQTFDTEHRRGDLLTLLVFEQLCHPRPCKNEHIPALLLPQSMLNQIQRRHWRRRRGGKKRRKWQERDWRGEKTHRDKALDLMFLFGLEIKVSAQTPLQRVLFCHKVVNTSPCVALAPVGFF